jgi:hypothetical protein
MPCYQHLDLPALRPVMLGVELMVAFVTEPELTVRLVELLVSASELEEEVLLEIPVEM